MGTVSPAMSVMMSLYSKVPLIARIICFNFLSKAINYFGQCNPSSFPLGIIDGDIATMSSLGMSTCFAINYLSVAELKADVIVLLDG